MMQIGNVWMRFIFPLYVFGGFQFTWYTLYNFSPRFAVLNLFNPMLYGIEGMRGAILGQQGYLPFWYCAGALVVLTALFFVVGYRRLKKQLDFI